MNYFTNNPSTDGFFNPFYWLIGVGIFLLVYFSFREFRCWYLKTNKILKLLEEIKENITSRNQEKRAAPISSEAQMDTDRDRSASS